MFLMAAGGGHNQPKDKDLDSISKHPAK